MHFKKHRFVDLFYFYFFIVLKNIWPSLVHYIIHKWSQLITIIYETPRWQNEFKGSKKLLNVSRFKKKIRFLIY